MVLALLTSFGLATLLGYTAVVEGTQMQLIVFGGLSRLVLISGIVLFINHFTARAFDSNEIGFILAQQISREKFLLLYWFIFGIISTLLLSGIMLLMIIFCHPQIKGMLLWAWGVLGEILLVSLFALTSSLITESFIVATIASFSFYVFSRLLGLFHHTELSLGDSRIYNLLVLLLNSFSTLMLRLIPRLDLFSQSRWLTEGGNLVSLKIMSGQIFIYITVLFPMAFYDLRQKQF
jgi:hypothetical protein